MTRDYEMTCAKYEAEIADLKAENERLKESVNNLCRCLAEKERERAASEADREKLRAELRKYQPFLDVIKAGEAALSGQRGQDKV